MVIGLPKENKNNEFRVGLTPDAVARTSTQALLNATLPYDLELAAKGVEQVCAEDRGLLAALI